MKTTTKLYNSSLDRRTGGGNYRRLWSTTSRALIAALHSVKGFAQAEQALYAFDTARAALIEHTVGDDASTIATTLADQFAAGETIDSTEFRLRLEDMHHRRQIAELERTVVSVVASRLINDRDTIATKSENLVVRSLDRQLNEFLENLRSKGVTANDLDATQAIANGRVEQHKLLTAAVETFADIRSGVTDLHMSFGVTEGEPDYLLASMVKEPLTLAPLAGVALAGFTASQSTTGKTFGPKDLPWPDPAETIAFLAWLISIDESQVRIPTTKQLRATLDELRRARAAANAAAKNRLRMRRTYGNGFLGQKSHEIEPLDHNERGTFATVPPGLDTEDGDWRVQRDVTLFD